ncbi:MAG: hypothetical protein ACLTLQ_00025 [[Clostridium] scindens]
MAIDSMKMSIGHGSIDATIICSSAIPHKGIIVIGKQGKYKLEKIGSTPPVHGDRENAGLPGKS